MNKKNYIVAKTNLNGETIIIDYKKINGLKISPKNNIEYPGIVVNSLILIKPSLIEKTLKRKIKIKLNYYLQYIISLMDSDDDSDGNKYREALNDLSRYKDIIEYKYRKYLDDKYINLLLKKISVLENEMKSKVAYKTINNTRYIEKLEEKEEEKGKSR